jgi:hypothetical protein
LNFERLFDGDGVRLKFGRCSGSPPEDLLLFGIQPQRDLRLQQLVANGKDAME